MSKKQSKIYLFANWKMYLDYDESNILANALAGEAKKFKEAIEMAVFPSALSLYPVGQVLRDIGIGVGPQNLYWIDKGGYTGEVSAAMYKAAGCDYALVGHSERRHLFHESHHETRQKLAAALAAGLTPVLCVGETLAERNAGGTKEVIEIQLRSALDNINWPQGRELIIAYEPVWAISKGAGKDEAGLHCDDAETERMHKLIAEEVAGLLPGILPIMLFGGSVRPNTTEYYLKMPHVQGVLVGAASTKLESWLEIIKSAMSLKQK